MDQFVALLALFGLNPATLGTALGLAVALRFGRGMLPWLNSAWTYASAVALGALGAWVEAVQGQPPQAFAKTALGLFCVVLLGQKLLEGLAEVASFIPKDNEWVKK